MGMSRVGILNELRLFPGTSGEKGVNIVFYHKRLFLQIEKSFDPILLQRDAAQDVFFWRPAPFICFAGLLLR